MFEADLDDERIELKGFYIPIEFNRSFVVGLVQFTLICRLYMYIKRFDEQVNFTCVHPKGLSFECVYRLGAEHTSS